MALLHALCFLRYHPAFCVTMHFIHLPGWMDGYGYYDGYWIHATLHDLEPYFCSSQVYLMYLKNKCCNILHALNKSCGWASVNVLVTTREPCQWPIKRSQISTQFTSHGIQIYKSHHDPLTQLGEIKPMYLQPSNSRPIKILQHFFQTESWSQLKKHSFGRLGILSALSSTWLI